MAAHSAPDAAHILQTVHIDVDRESLEHVGNWFKGEDTSCGVGMAAQQGIQTDVGTHIDD